MITNEGKYTRMIYLLELGALWCQLVTVFLALGLQQILQCITQRLLGISTVVLAHSFLVIHFQMVVARLRFDEGFEFFFLSKGARALATVLGNQENKEIRARLHTHTKKYRYRLKLNVLKIVYTTQHKKAELLINNSKSLPRFASG